MQKIPGVSRARVSLNEGLTVLDLKDENSVTLSHLRQVIRNNGFVTREAQVVARGLVTISGNQMRFEVSGSGESITLSPAEKAAAPYQELRERVSAAHTLDAVIVGRVDLSDPRAFRITVESSRLP